MVLFAVMKIKLFRLETIEICYINPYTHTTMTVIVGIKV